MNGQDWTPQQKPIEMAVTHHRPRWKGNCPACRMYTDVRSKCIYFIISVQICGCCFVYPSYKKWLLRILLCALLVRQCDVHQEALVVCLCCHRIVQRWVTGLIGMCCDISCLHGWYEGWPLAPSLQASVCSRPSRCEHRFIIINIHLYRQIWQPLMLFSYKIYQYWGSSFIWISYFKLPWILANECEDNFRRLACEHGNRKSFIKQERS